MITGAALSSVPKAASALGHSFGVRGGALHHPIVTLGRTGAATTRRPNTSKCPAGIAGGPARPGCVGSAYGEGGGTSALADHSHPATESDAGRAMVPPQAALTPGTQQASVAVSLGAQWKASVGKDPEPLAPQSEDARISSSVVTTNAAALLPRQALALVSRDT